jgi:hypothetical protein
MLRRTYAHYNTRVFVAVRRFVKPKIKEKTTNEEGEITSRKIFLKGGKIHFLTGSTKLMDFPDQFVRVIRFLNESDVFFEF